MNRQSLGNLSEGEYGWIRMLADFPDEGILTNIDSSSLDFLDEGMVLTNIDSASLYFLDENFPVRRMD